jgi:serine phosphatase RsbU (regulator of sigma subunit)/anti-sigma regulatory factor (Ser/Thr protein kinase)
MATRLRTFWQILNRQPAVETETVQAPGRQLPRRPAPEVELAVNDPIIAYFQSAPGAVEIDKLDLDSPGLRALKENGVKLTVPLVSQGELIGLLNLGPRLSEQEYSADDRGLLNNLATQAAPALRVAQLVRQQQAEVQARERIEQELRVARLIQQTLLPKELPVLEGWKLATHYQPARAVGGDFYDFIHLQDGRLALVVGDVTDKGVPAALVMATTRSILRSAAEHFDSPGQVLERANNLLTPDIPPNMFVTCLYAILDPESGKLVYANAGHDLPHRRHKHGIEELRATGMPLGLIPEMRYEQKETFLEPGDSILFYSDGLVEAHNSQREMFGFERLKEFIACHPGGSGLIEFMLEKLAEFTGPEWEQEDDVTFLSLERVDESVRSGEVIEETDYSSMLSTSISSTGTQDAVVPTGETALVRADFNETSKPGNERQVIQRVEASLRDVNLTSEQMERLKTAVGEAAMNAMEHGNQYNPDLPVSVRVVASESAVTVTIIDQGSQHTFPKPETPDIEAKLAGLQSSRGWGLFLIKNMVDEMIVSGDENHNKVELIVYLEGAKDARKNA